MAELKKWPSWRYGPNGESKLCQSQSDVPKGWFDHHKKAAKADQEAEAKAAAEAEAKKKAEASKKPEA